MDEELWFEEEILPLAAQAGALAAGLKALEPEELAEAMGEDTLAGMTKAQRAEYAEEFARDLRGTVLAYRPRARRLTAAEEAGAMAPGVAFARGDLYLVRLGMEFELENLPEKYRKARCRFVKAWCRAYVSGRGPDLPRVLDIAPDQVYEGGPRFVRVEAKPALSWADAEASLGSVATDLQLGHVSPATVGYLGKDEREPHWKLSEKERAIEGRRHFWLLLETPPGYDPAAARLALLGEADVRSPLSILGLIPRSRARTDAQAMTLAEMLR